MCYHLVATPIFMTKGNIFHENRLLSIKILCKYLNIAYKYFVRKLITVYSKHDHFHKISNYHTILSL